MGKPSLSARFSTYFTKVGQVPGGVRADVGLGLGLAISAAIATALVGKSLDPAVFGQPALDSWFQADLWRIVSDASSLDGVHTRTGLHPLFSLISLTLVTALRSIWHASDVNAVLHAQAIIAAIWTGAFFALCRLLDATRLQALVFTLVATTSSAFVYWFSMPETGSWASLSLLGVLLVAAWCRSHTSRNSLLFFASAGSLSFTVTNWVSGLVLAFVHRRRKQALVLSLAAFAAIAGLSLVQKVMLPKASPLLIGSSHEVVFLNCPHSGGPFRKVADVLFNTMVLPRQSVFPSPKPLQWTQLSVQLAIPGSASIFGYIAVALWVVVLGAGIGAAVVAFRQQKERKFLLVVALSLCAQLALHSVYGDETFLYSPNQLPLLVCLALFSLRLKQRRILLIAASLLVVFNVVNDAKALAVSRAHIVSNLSEHDKMLAEQRNRPQEVWPRGIGHVILAQPGSTTGAKAYIEPGGAFSPKPGSFGVSVWVTAEDNRTIVTSDTVALGEVQQGFGELRYGIPAVHTVTPSFEVELIRLANEWEFRTLCRVSEPNHCWLVVRSVGPAGGPLTQAQWDRDVLQMNNGRWSVNFEAIPAARVVDSERSKNIQLAVDGKLTGTDTSGWIYAAARLPERSAVRIPIDEHVTCSTFHGCELLTQGVQREPAEVLLPTDLLRPNVPERDFGDVVVAQQLHLLMGLTGSETRPGDPLAYSQDWLRDSTYVVVALLRAGHLTAARKLMRKMARHDFYGKFGPEADALGLALWTMGEVAEALEEPTVDSEFWPDVVRKATLIEQCANSPLGLEADPLWWPESDTRRRVCGPSALGLITGRFDWRYPAQYATATSYLGLQQASRWAERLGREDYQRRWHDLALRLASSWESQLLKSQRARMRDAFSEIYGAVLAPKPAGLTGVKSKAADIELRVRIMRDHVSFTGTEVSTTAGMWPSWIAAGDDRARQAYAQLLANERAREWDDQGRPRSTPVNLNISFAEAHQWLLLGNVERTRATLAWAMTQSASPGLYSWGSGTGEPSSSSWTLVRGNRSPETVSPHYWTAAELLLLQLDFLAYVDESKPERPILIGAGAVPAWHTLGVDSGTLHTTRGRLAWSLHNDTLEVRSSRPDVPIVVSPPLSNAKLVRRLLQ